MEYESFFDYLDKTAEDFFKYKDKYIKMIRFVEDELIPNNKEYNILGYKHSKKKLSFYEDYNKNKIITSKFLGKHLHLFRRHLCIYLSSLFFTDVEELNFNKLFPAFKLFLKEMLKYDIIKDIEYPIKEMFNICIPTYKDRYEILVLFEEITKYKTFKEMDDKVRTLSDDQTKFNYVTDCNDISY